MRKLTMTSGAALAAVALAGSVAAAPASASDATLKAAIEQVIPQVSPTLTSFIKAAKAADKSGDLTGLQQATVDVRTGISQYKWTVINYKADTASGLANKKALLVAIREYDIGFAAYNNALTKLKAGASKASTLKSLRSFAKRLDEAVKDEAAALDALGVQG